MKTAQCHDLSCGDPSHCHTSESKATSRFIQTLGLLVKAMINASPCSFPNRGDVFANSDPGVLNQTAIAIKGQAVFDRVAEMQLTVLGNGFPMSLPD